MTEFVIAVYLRLSSEDQDLKQGGKAESNSIGNQRNLILDFIRRIPEFAGATILEFCDDGWSGKNFERSGVQEMLGLVKEGKIQCIIVKDISRFGRDYLEVGNYLSRVFPFLNVRFIAVNDGFDSIRPADIDSLDTSFKTLLYDLYSRDLSRKVRSAKRQRAEKGKFLSPFAPFGFVKDPADKNRLLIDPEAAQIVRRIFHMMASGQSADEIARVFNDELIPTPMIYKRRAGCSRTVWPCIHEDNFWTRNYIDRILRDERYIGKAVYGKRMRDKVGNTHTIKISRSDWVVVDNTHEGIVTPEEFERAQAQMRAYAEKEGKPINRDSFSRRLYCGVCGHRLTRVNTKAPYYRCQTSRFTSAYDCTGDPIPENDLMDMVRDSLRMQAIYAVELGKIWKEQHKKKQADSAALRKTLTGLKENCRKLDQQIRELYEGFALGEISKAEYLAAKQAAAQRREAAGRRMEELEAQLENTGADGGLQNRFVDCFQKYVDIESLTDEILSEVLEKVLVYPDNRIEIQWNYREDLERLLLEEQAEDLPLIRA